jgi:hypothetical protein
MTQPAYHPATDRSILLMHADGNTPEEIAEELCITLAYVNQRLATEPNTAVRAQIIDMWKSGIGKKEISARLILPLPIIQTIIAQSGMPTRRPPRTTNPDANYDATEELLNAGEQSTRHRTRQLATRARTTLEALTTAVQAEAVERELQQRVDRAAAQLAEAQQALREHKSV